MFTMDDLFEIAIKMEKNGEAVYIDALSRIDNKELKPILQWMADEEASHRKWFKNQQNKLSISLDEQQLKEMVPDILQQMMGDHALSLEDIDFSKIENITDLLKTFIGFEKDTIQFYEMLEMFIEDESIKKGLDIIIQEEKAHVAKLEKMIQSL